MFSVEERVVVEIDLEQSFFDLNICCIRPIVISKDAVSDYELLGHSSPNATILASWILYSWVSHSQIAESIGEYGWADESSSSNERTMLNLAKRANAQINEETAHRQPIVTVVLIYKPFTKLNRAYLF